MKPDHKTHQRPGRYKVTLKVFNENDEVVYVRLPPKASWFVCTSSGSIDPKLMDQLFAQAEAADLPEGTRPVYTMPEVGTNKAAK